MCTAFFCVLIVFLFGKGCVLFFLFRIDAFVLPGHFDIVVMAAYVLYALALQFRDALGVKDELFQFIAHTLVRRLYVDDRAQFVLSKYLVVLGFTATYADNTL